MRTIHYVVIFFLIAVLALVRFDLARRVDNLKISAARNMAEKSAVIGALPKTASNTLPNSNTDPVQAPVIGPKYDSQIFIEKFKAESAEVAKVQNDPEAAQQRMKKLAKLMNPQDVEALFDIIADDKKDGDQRALAVELLAIKNDTASLVALQNFVGNNNTANGIKWDRKKELETVLRAQAIEGIASYPQKDIAISTLSYLQHKVDERFLLDRLSRAAANLSNRAPTPQQQDEAALKKLVE